MIKLFCYKAVVKSKNIVFCYPPRMTLKLYKGSEDYLQDGKQSFDQGIQKLHSEQDAIGWNKWEMFFNENDVEEVSFRRFSKEILPKSLSFT